MFTHSHRVIQEFSPQEGLRAQHPTAQPAVGSSSPLRGTRLPQPHCLAIFSLPLQSTAGQMSCRTDVAQPSSHGQFREEELDGPFCVTGTGPTETTTTMSKHCIQLENSMKLVNISSTGQIWAPAVACRSRIRSNSKVSQSSGSFSILSGQFASLPCKGLAESHAAKQLSVVVLTLKNKNEFFRDTEMCLYNHIVHARVSVTSREEHSPKRRGETQQKSLVLCLGIWETCLTKQRTAKILSAACDKRRKKELPGAN